MKNNTTNDPISTREDFIIDTALFEYYNKNFTTSNNIHSIPKLKMMKSIHEYQYNKKKKKMWLLLASTSAAILILLSTYISFDFTQEVKIDEEIQIVE